jgi:hypothetical protein
VRSNIVINTDTSITIPFRAWRASIAAAVVNGDTFRVFQPGTVINCPDVATGTAYVGCYDWVGSAEYPLSYSSGGSPRHGFYNLQFTGTRFATRNASLHFIGVRSSLAIVFFDSSRISAHGPSNGAPWGVGASAVNNLISSYGLIDTAATYLIGNKCLVGGVFCVATSLNIGTEIAGEGDVFVYKGGRFEAGITLIGGTFQGSGGGNTYTLIQGPLLISKVSKMHLFNGSGTTSKVVFAVTSGSCIDLSDNSLVNLTSTTGLSGGTSDVAGYGIRLRGGGGRVLLTAAPTLTGGTPGADIKTSVLGAQPNAFLAAAGDFISDLGGAEIVARI